MIKNNPPEVDLKRNSKNTSTAEYFKAGDKEAILSYLPVTKHFYHRSKNTKKY